MPRYHFHIRDHDRIVPDEEGIELECMERAVDEARLCARDMLNDAIADGQDITHQVIEITSPDGTVIACHTGATGRPLCWPA